MPQNKSEPIRDDVSGWEERDPRPKQDEGRDIEGRRPGSGPKSTTGTQGSGGGKVGGGGGKKRGAP